jgi:hypothetical protein
MSTAAFARSLLHAAGLGLAAAAVLGGAACGGKVAVDNGGGPVSSSSSSSGSMTCDQMATVYEAMEVCVGPGPTDGCLAKDDPALVPMLVEQMNMMACGSDLASVLCGPTSPTFGQCCYVVDGTLYLCGGRPFVVDGAARTAAGEARADWLLRVADAGDVDEDTRCALAEAWTRSALDEHASVASFARFVLELLGVGAPADLVSRAQRALGDEIRHAELCFGLASAFAGRAVGPGPLAVAGAAPARVDLAEIAAAAVREGCVGETLAAFEAAVARDAAEHPAVRVALDVIARDEADHAALAYRFVAWALRAGDARVHAAVHEAFTAALAAPPSPPPEVEGDAGALRAHGQLPLAERRALAARCLAEVVAPSFAALALDARQAGEAESPSRKNELYLGSL